MPKTSAHAANVIAVSLTLLASVFAQSPPAPAPDTAAETSPDAPLEAPSTTPELGGGSLAELSPPRIQQGQPSAARAPSPPASPWKVLFFENDFEPYVGKAPYVFGEELKLMPLDLPGDSFDMTLSVGGQVRHRYAYEDDRIRPGGFEKNDYQQWRWRQYYDLKNDYFRVYVETIEADTFGEELAPLPIDVNRFDVLNAFIDVNVYDDEDYGHGTYRFGRQELLYGKQRLLSPLDWSNTRRNFQGHKFFHVADNWRFDAFAVNPVNAVARAGVDFDRYDSQADEADHRRTLFGAYLSLTGDPMLSADLYMLYQDDERPRRNFAEGDRGLNGARLYGLLPAERGRRVWDYDIEGGYQWGSDLGERVAAGFATAELGHTWKNLAGAPRIAGLFYYGSGGSSQNTFYTYYPLGHAYWGIIDNLSGQNLLDFSPQFAVKPTKKLNVTGAYHYFMKADGDGFLYNVAQVPVPPTGIGRDIGHETDLVATYNVNSNFNVQAGYAHFWYGNVGKAITGKNDADFFYFMTTFNY